MERPNIEEVTPEIAAYIDYLEKRVDGASRLSKEISLLKDGVAHDLMLIRNGEQGDAYEHLKYVCLDRLSPKYNLVTVLMKNINVVEEGPAKVGRPKKEAEESETLPIAGELEPEAEANVVSMTKENPFEVMSRKIQQQTNRK